MFVTQPQKKKDIFVVLDSILNSYFSSKGWDYRHFSVSACMANDDIFLVRIETNDYIDVLSASVSVLELLYK